jgi:hypothetical protein
MKTCWETIILLNSILAEFLLHITLSKKVVNNNDTLNKVNVAVMSYFLFDVK